MQQNPIECPTWDEFLRPLLELAIHKPIKRRTSTELIATNYEFSEEITNLRHESGQRVTDNRCGWAMSSLVKAEFIEKHPSIKHTYQITQKGRDYLEQHVGPITHQDLNNLEGYKEAWEKASELNKNRRKERDFGLADHTYAHPYQILFPEENADEYLDVFKRAFDVIFDEYPDAERIICVSLTKRSSKHYRIRINVGIWATLGLSVNDGSDVWEATLKDGHPLTVDHETKTIFKETVDGQTFVHQHLPRSFGFEEVNELWPAIEEGLRAAVKFQTSISASPYKQHHKPELLKLILEPESREQLLATPLEQVDQNERAIWIISPGALKRL